MKILCSMTYPQIRMIDKLFKEKYNLTLLDFIRDDKSISSNGTFPPLFFSSLSSANTSLNIRSYHSRRINSWTTKLGR